MTFKNLTKEYQKQYHYFLSEPKLLKEIHDNSSIDNNDEVNNWLAKLELLYGVPFEYLVIQEEMLPIESIKFFYIDGNWINALKDGACSIGRETIHEEMHDKIILPKILSSSKIDSYNARKLAFKHDQKDEKNLFTAQDLENDDKQIITGFLLRSKVVSEWPGMEIHVYDEQNIELQILRLDHISNNILIGLYDGTIDHIEISQPTEVLHSGFDPKGKNADNFYEKTLRNNDDGTEIQGKRVAIDDNFYNNKDYNIINMTKLAQALGSNTSAEFALQMITGVDKVILRTKIS